MGFFESLGNIRADIQMPLIQRQLQHKYDQQRLQYEDALNQAVALKEQKQQAEDPQVPLRPQTFGDADNLKLQQQLKLAGIDTSALAQADKYRAEAEQAALRTRNLQESFEDIDSSYARANIANKLDVSPVRMSGETAYNRFDPDNWLTGVTAKGQAETLSSEQKAHQKNIELEVLKSVITDQDMPFSKKLDYISGKEISDTERIEVIDRSGNKVYGTRYWTPSGYKIKKDTDTQGEYVSIPASETTYAKQRDIEDLVTAGYTREEATRIVLAKDSSSASIYSDINKALRSGKFPELPITDPFELQAKTIQTYAQERPGQRLPRGIKESLKLNNFSEEQEAELQALIKNTNDIADLVSRNGQLTEQDAGDVVETPSVSSAPSPALVQPQPSQPVPLIQPEPLAQPQQQPQSLKPITQDVMNSAYQAFSQGAPPAEIRQRLEGSGFDVSPETVAVMAIDAINQGADREQVAERFKAMGYDLGAMGI